MVCVGGITAFGCIRSAKADPTNKMSRHRITGSRQRDAANASAFSRLRAVLWCLLPVARCLLLAFGCLLLSACGPTKQEQAAQRAVSDYFVGDYQSAVRILSELSQEPDENFALNNARLGSAALIEYRLDEAEAAFLKAYEVMNSVGVNDGGRTLGAVLVDEKIRIWKGEPFERAMVNFYLGLTYYMRADYQNARAAFENALFKLREYGDKEDGVSPDDYTEIESRFALGYLMLGKSWIHLGREDLAEANLARAAMLQPGIAPLADMAHNARANVTLVVDYGHGPRYERRYGGAIAGFSPKPAEAGRVPPPQIVINGALVSMPGLDQPPVDLLALAQQQRWQSIDTIRTIKSTVGTALIAGGAGYGAYRANQGRFNDDDLAISGGLIATGLLLRATSQADVRQWEMLPRSTFVIPLELPPGRHDLTIAFPPTHSAAGYEQTWYQIEAPAKGEATYYLRMRRWDSGPFTWPPPHLDQAGRRSAGAH